MSRNSDAFVDNLKGAFQYMGVDAMDIYKRQLAKWDCTASQWEGALSEVITSAEPGRVPELRTIFEALKNQQRRVVGQRTNTGRAYFTVAGKSYCIFIESVDRRWLVADVTTTRNGETVHLQPRSGEWIMDAIPQDTLDPKSFVIVPDHPARNDTDIPTENEKAAYMAVIRENLAKFGNYILYYHGGAK